MDQTIAVKYVYMARGSISYMSWIKNLFLAPIHIFHKFVYIPKFKYSL